MPCQPMWRRAGVTYTAVHVHGAGNIATACQQQSVARLVHISGIGANPASRSPYIRARGLGELAVQKAFPPATVLRPSVMFAVNEGLLGVLEKLARSTPIIPLIGGGRTRLQPVHVNDVAEAVYQSLRNPDAVGKTYELGAGNLHHPGDPRPGSCPQGALPSFHFYPVCARFSARAGSRALPWSTIDCRPGGSS